MVLHAQDALEMALFFRSGYPTYTTYSLQPVSWTNFEGFALLGTNRGISQRKN